MKSHLEFGIILCALHLLISWFFIIGIALPPHKEQWQLAWLFLYPSDWPVSLLIGVGDSISPFEVSFLPYPVNQFHDFLLPTFVHGLIGPLWYLIAGVGIGAIALRIKRARKQE